MTKYREILRLHALGLSQQNIADSCGVSKKTVNRVIKRAKELKIFWPLEPNQTDAVLAELLFPSANHSSKEKRMPDYEYVRKELLRNGVSKKLLWTEYMETCRQNGDEPLMYSQFCYYIQQDEQRRHATMHINRKPGEQAEVDWAGDTAALTDPDTGEIIPVYVFVGAMTYSRYAYAEAFPDEKQNSWITAHNHMFQYFGGIPRIIVPDNCKTAVIHSNRRDDPRINAVYHEIAEHYGTAIIPARIRAPRDKPNAEQTVRNISTWIIAAVRDEQFFSLADLNAAIRKKLDEYNRRPFQKKDGSRWELFRDEELPMLAPLPESPYELAEWKQATVQFNYHISVEGMMYSVPYEYIRRVVDVRLTDTTVEIFYHHNRIASHKRLHGRKGQYATIIQHMPEDHQKYLEWNGDRFRKWAEKIGPSTYAVINSLLASRRVEQQSYRGCMGILRLEERYSSRRLESACEKALTYTSSPSYKSIKNILAAGIKDPTSDPDGSDEQSTHAAHGITRGADYYRR